MTLSTYYKLKEQLSKLLLACLQKELSVITDTMTLARLLKEDRCLKSQGASLF